MTGDFEKAADCYQSALRVDELTEEFYQRLMNCYHKLGRKAEAIKTYHRCCSALKANMSVEPSPETTAIYHNITHSVKEDPAIIAQSEFYPQVRI